MVHLFDLHHLHQGDRDVDIDRNDSAIFVIGSFSIPNWRNVFVVVVFEDDEFAAIFVGFVPAVCHLVTPLLHLDALPVVAGELVLFATGQFQRRVISFSFVALIGIVRDRPVVFAKDIS